ncbi:hypothetical protein PIB30_104652 [Stylosanthes scabra]|uniref:Uncharacterized protein n=1 Tax=Stylosanthes scabra TaxID=79078 RepID=A0ABU6UXA3_9FABA|nr:hypothetical protein [Stylosanthes scabra]
MVINVFKAMQYPKEEDAEGCMRIDIIEELIKEVQQEEAMQKFQEAHERKIEERSLQIKKRNLEAKQSKAPRICMDEHAYACCSYPNPRLNQPTTLRRGNLLDQSHAYA